MSKLKVLLALLASISFFLFAETAHATHFRYGNISYTVPDPVNAPKTVRFDVVAAWRADAVDGSGFAATNLDFGDGQSNGTQEGLTIGNGVDASGLAYKVQRYSATHTYPTQGVYTAFFTSCCRISTLTVDADASFRVEAVVDLTPGNTGNAVSALPAIFQLQTGGVRTFQIPGIDPDGVPVHCRFATPAECASPTMPPPIPGGALPTLQDTPTGCTMTWNTATATAGQSYPINVVIESYNGPTRADAMVDFIIEMTAAPPPTCTGGGVYNVDLGTQFTQPLVGTNSVAANLKMTNIGTFGNLSPPPGTTQPSPFTTTYSISPSVGDSGVSIMTVLYTNPQNLTGFCTVAVKIPACANFGKPCSVGIGACQGNGFKYCLNGAELCSAVAGSPSSEVCDGKDNNCNGTVDEGNPEAGQACTTALPGLCAAGTTTCNAGVKECHSNIQPGTITETCDGVDQDCDGTVDNGFNAGEPCLEGDGQCLAAGIYVCTGPNTTTCNADPGPPTMEACDGKDNDCDQQIDEDFPLGEACTSGLGLCQKAGVIVCDANGGSKCDAVPGIALPEQCGNALDEDCDGVLNNGCGDSDDDGLFDNQEIAVGLDPSDPDNDDDGVLDGDEPQWDQDTDGDGLINALDPDSDDDGLADGTELGKGCDSPGTDASKGHCVADADPDTQTDPLDPDTDGGGAKDGSEDANLNGKVDADETSPVVKGDDAQSADTDGDGLGDLLEKGLGTNMMDADSDDDGLFDGLEPNPTMDMDGDGLVSPIDVDSDDDALFDGLEAGKDCGNPDTDVTKKHCHFDGDPSTKTGVLSRDTDRGGVRDGSEDGNLNGVVGAAELDPNVEADDVNVVDSDGDGLSDSVEARMGSNPLDADSDDDGVLDGDEANPSDDADGDGQLNLMDYDADNDGLFDGTELGLECNNADTDKSQGHCVADADLGATRTNPLLADTDLGGRSDGIEDLNLNGKVDSGETDPNNKADDVQIECIADSECAAGKVCEDRICVSGCRGTNPDACPMGQTCTSTDETIGQCTSGEGGSGGGTNTGGTGGEGGGGCGCRTAGDTSNDGLGLVALIGLTALAASRRRRKNAA